MKHNKIYALFAALLMVSMVLSACQPAATAVAPTTPSQSTAAPTTSSQSTAAPTTPSQPTAAPSMAYPLTLAAPDCKYGGEFKAITAKDANTVVFDLCNPDPAFPAKAAFASNEILPKALLDATGGDSAKITAKIVGTGPMTIKEWVKGDHITLVANPNYWGPAPTMKTVIFKWSAQPAQRLLELSSGNVDGYELVGPEDTATIKKDATLQYTPIVSANTMYFGMNNTKPPFDNEKVRQAFAMAIDKQRIVKNFYPEGSAVADQFLYQGLEPGYTEGSKWYDYNQTLAKQMLTDAKFDFSKEIPFSYRTNSRGYVPNPAQVAEDVQAQLANIGVKIKLDVQESGTLLGNAGKGNLTFFLLGWGEDYPDATDWFDYHFGPEGKSFGTPYPDLVAAITAGGTTADNAARQKAYDQVNTLIKQHVPVNPIAHGASGDAFKASVKNVVISVYNQNFPYMQTDSGQLVWLQTSEPISLNCGDETDGETINACMLVNEPLLRYKYGTTQTEPALATAYEANTDLTQYTFHMRPNVKWSDGSIFTAADVFATYTAQWDYKNPNHKGNTGTFEYYGGLFGKFLNQPPAPTPTP